MKEMKNVFSEPNLELINRIVVKRENMDEVITEMVENG